MFTNYVYIYITNDSIDPGDGEVMINFEDMKAVTSFGEVQLRRLSTKSAVLPTDHALSTQWVWHWLDENGIWRQYGCEPSVSLSNH